MEIKNLIQQAEYLGIQLWVEDAKLKFKAPTGAMNDELREKLKAHKPAIIAYLIDRSVLIHDEGNCYQPFAMTDIQTAYLVGSSKAYGYGETGCKVFLQLTVPKLEIERLQQAWQKVVERHDLLRTQILKNGQQQVSLTMQTPKIQSLDFRSLDQTTTNQRLKKLEQVSLAKQFDAETGPLYEIVLIKTDNDDFLCLTVDMLIADFTSMKIIVSDLEKAYYDRPFDDLEITFRDYICFKQNSRSEAKYNQAKEYWEKRLTSIPEAPELPVNINKSAEKSVQFEQYSQLISVEQWEKLTAFAKKYELTPSVLLLTAYTQVLGLWSRQQDFTINLTMAERPNIHEDIAKIVGDFTTVNLLEVHNGGRKSFIALAEEIQKQLWSDLRYTDFSGVAVMRELNRQEEAVRLFPVVFTSTLGAMTQTEKNQFKLDYKISQTPQVWIDCQVSSQANGVLVNWDVRKNIFPAGMIPQAFTLFIQCIEKCINQPEQLNQYVPLVLCQDVLDIRKKVNNTQGAIPKGLLYDDILKNIQNFPNQIAVIHDGIAYSYERLGCYAQAVKTVLCEHGVTEGEQVAINLGRGIWQVAAVLGTMWAGAIYLPLDSEQPSGRKERILHESKTKYCITTKNSLFDGVENVIADAAQLPEKFELTPVRVHPADPAYIIYTSGSTGTPKGVVISHTAALNTIDDIISRFELTKQDRVLAIANLAFDLSVFDIFGLLAVGGGLVIPSQDRWNDPQHWYELANKYQVTIWNSVPAQMQMLTSYLHSLKNVETGKLKIILLSGDWLPVTLPKEIYCYFPNSRVFSLGGATEAAIWSIYYPIEPNKQYTHSIPYGTPLRNQYFKILNDNQADCPDDVVGNLCIGGVGLAAGYLNDQETTQNKFIHHPDSNELLYQTGDLGKYRPDGIIEFIGRDDHQVKVRGHRIELKEIESTLETLTKVETAIAVHSEDATEQKIAVFVQAKSNPGNQRTLVPKADLQQAVQQAGEDGTKTIDRKLFADWAEVASLTAIYDIWECFQQHGVFTDGREISLLEIQKKLKVHPYYHRLLHRWLDALCAENLIIKQGKHAYVSTQPKIPVNAAEKSWKKWWEIENQMHYGKKLVSYFEESSQNLPALLRGDIDAIDLFFPKGDFSIAMAAYHDNLVSKAMNQVMIGALSCIMRKQIQSPAGKPIRILEVGAGVGGASLDIIPALAEEQVEYVFTDVSQFFINEAQKNFAAYPFVKYSLFDINKPYWQQGIKSSSFDVIICNNVLHNAKNLPKVLREFREILVPGGAFIVADTTGENHSLLTSMAFHAGLSDFEDFRAKNNQTFVSKEEWLQVFADEKIELASVYPAANDSLAQVNQAVFVGQYVSDKELLTKKEVRTAMQDKLPDYMVPKYIEIIEQFPMTQNGKIDRGLLTERLQASSALACVDGNQVVGSLETAIEKIWVNALNKDKIWRDENFYQAGGDSLLLAQIVSEMKEAIVELETWSWDQLMTEIIDSPTIAEIAEKITLRQDTDSERSAESEEAYIQIYERNETTESCLVLFHDGTGTLTPYGALLPHIVGKENQNSWIIGVQCGGKEDYLQHSTENLLSELGQKYAQELTKLNFNHFKLVGYCMGGLVALETADYLLEAGKEVEPVITIDTTPCDSRLRNNLLMERTFGLLVGADMEKSGHYVDEDLLKAALLNLLASKSGDITIEDLCSLSGEFKSVGECYQKLAEQSEKTRLLRLFDNIARLDTKTSEFQQKRLTDLYEIFCQSFAGMSLYGREFFTGDVVALNCQDKASNFLPVLESKNNEFWRELTLGDLQLVTIKGDHISCMQEPYVQDIGEFIRNFNYKAGLG